MTDKESKTTAALHKLRSNLTRRKVKNCPFCGHKPKVIETTSLFNDFSGWSVLCTCEMHPSTSLFDLREDAINLWNTRRSGK